MTTTTARTRSARLLPGGVDCPVQPFGAVGGEPVFFERGTGALVRDADGNTYIDWMCSWRPLILGHAGARVVAGVAIVRAAMLSGFHKRVEESAAALAHGPAEIDETLAVALRAFDTVTEGER